LTDILQHGIVLQKEGVNMQKRICGKMIKRIHDAVERKVNNLLRAQDMTMAQAGVLLELQQAPEKQMPLKELERILHVAQPTVAGIVVRLEQKGFVESFVDSADRRVKIARITPKGEAYCLQADKNIEEIEKKLLSPLTEAEQAVFLDMLEKICDRVTEVF